MRAGQPPLDRYVVRFGETLEQIAAAHRTSDAAARRAERDRAGRGRPRRHRAPRSARDCRRRAAAPRSPGGAAGAKPSVVVPADVFVYPDRKRVFYRVQVGDTLREIAGALHVSVDDLDRWNDIDPAARLQEG